MPLPGWMPSLLESISYGCAHSPLIALPEEGDEVLLMGRQLCLDLWPFIEGLPGNIVSVREAIPERMESARKLLDQLSDDERQYQQMFRRQCHLAGLSDQDLADYAPTPVTVELCSSMRRYCRSKDYRDGIFAVTTAELSATAFSRNALPVFESYFIRNAHQYEASLVDEGLAWLRHHTQQQTKHALWLRRMLGDLGDLSSEAWPEPVEAVLSAMHNIWNTPKEICVVKVNNVGLTKKLAL